MKQTRESDHFSLLETRLFAAFSARIGELDPASPLLPRIDGLSKKRWAAHQMMLVSAVDAFDRIAGAGVPFILLRGASVLVEGIASARRRLSGEVEMLVRRPMARAAIEALNCAGWAVVDPRTQDDPSCLPRGRNAVAFRKGRHGRVVLHAAPFGRWDRAGSFDEALWQATRPAGFAGMEVRIPDPTTATLINLTIAPLRSHVDWVLDIGDRIAHQTIYWEEFVSASVQLGCVPSCLSGLLYLFEELAVAVPDTVLSALIAAAVPGHGWLKFILNERDPEDPRRFGKALNSLVKGLSRVSRYRERLRGCRNSGVGGAVR